MSFWGEVVEPSSRVWDDETAEESSNIRFSWTNKPSLTEPIETLVILEGTQFGGCNCENKLILINEIPQTNVKLFKDEKQSMLYVSLTVYDLVISSEIVELLLDYLIICKKVVAIVCRALAEYKTDERVSEPCIIKSLPTTSWTIDLPYPQLEQPNIITGVAAGVLSLREHLGEQAVAHICYIDHPDNVKSDELSRLLRSVGITRINAKPSSITNSNLYI